MLLRFSVSNHLSIRDPQELLFSTSAPQGGNDDLIPCSAAPEGAVLPLALIYGANASGKSNLVEAIHFMRRMVLNSHSKGEPGGGVPVQPFRLHNAHHHAPSRFEIDFVVDGMRYHYGFEASDKAFEQEWLYAFPGARPQLWFDRSGDKFRFGRELKGQKRIVADMVRPNSLLVSVGAQNDQAQLSKVYTYFRSIGGVQILAPGAQALANLLPTAGTLDSRVIDFLKDIRTGVVDYRVNELELSPRTQEFTRKLATVIRETFGPDVLGSDFERDQKVALELGHRANGDEIIYFELEAESAGTRRLLVILSSAFDAIDAGTLLCIDEVNASLHTQASEALLQRFCSRKHNPEGAQLIATTHDTNLLTSPALRRDEIWLTEKDDEGATHLYPLTDIETRVGDNLEKGYLQGRYGAVPFANPESTLGKN